MKKFTLVVFALVCGVAFMNCEAKKPKKEEAPQEDPEVAALKKQIELQKLQNELAAEQAKGATITLPCSEFMDDAFFFREVGVGSALKLQEARDAAFKSAKAMIRQKLAEFVQGFSTDFVSVYSNSKAVTDDVQRKLVSKMNATIEGMLNEANKVCESNRINNRGIYDAFYAIEISKAELKKNMADDLAADDKLGIDFNEHLFEQEMDRYWDKMQNDKKKAGY